MNLTDTTQAPRYATEFVEQVLVLVRAVRFQRPGESIIDSDVFRCNNPEGRDSSMTPKSLPKDCDLLLGAFFKYFDIPTRCTWYRTKVGGFHRPRQGMMGPTP